MNIPSITELFDLSHTIIGKVLKDFNLPYEVLPKLTDLILMLIKSLENNPEFQEIAPGVMAAKSAKISPSATIEGPAVIDEEAEIRPGAFIRKNAIIGKKAVIGNSTEIKNSIIFDGATLPHYNYAGDSIIGFKAHFGAGAIASNFRLDHANISIRQGDERIDTGLRKMGVMLGDNAEVGCNSVLFPGSIVGKRCMIYPLSRVRGILSDDTILK